MSRGGGPVVRTRVIPSSYRDSVELMRIAEELKGLEGVNQAGLVMGTPANCAVLAAAGLFVGPATEAGPNDLIVAVAAADTEGAERALAHAERLLTARSTERTGAGDGHGFVPTTIAEALAEAPDLDLAMISTPGDYATAEALKALKHGLNVFLFSDNVPIEDEIELKTLAREKGLLVMGPDCGTAIIDGVPLGFANAVRRGRIGLVAASGTGLQQVTCLVDRLGEGISQAIGVGGRDLDERIGGTMMLAGVERLLADPGTAVIVLVSKPPAPSVAARVLDAAVAGGKPLVAGFLGGDADVIRAAGAIPAVTLEDAAREAVALVRGEPPNGRFAEVAAASEPIEALARHEAGRLADGQWQVRGLYSGGTLAAEAKVVLAQSLGKERAQAHSIVDLGADEYTVGRPHPMIDPSLRNELVVAAAADADVAVLLLDVVLGYGAHDDPAGALRPALEEAAAMAGGSGRHLAFIASVCGTEGDPQGLAAQERALADAGVALFPSNAMAARFAGSVVLAHQGAIVR